MILESFDDLTALRRAQLEAISGAVSLSPVVKVRRTCQAQKCAAHLTSACDTGLLSPFTNRQKSVRSKNIVSRSYLASVLTFSL